ncbi:hypothetical protein EAI_15033 [Harpegnathos saltator]|uniref:Uncharacterized protein n=1 Tax=Harpegnathos saltator TaxID=610380 RepID=E2BDH3_HARSA|nr:hypothetical protein EAI_15033 [Harpegnathos saltator]
MNNLKLKTAKWKRRGHWQRTLADRLGSIGSTGFIGSAANISENACKQSGVDIKIDWLIKTVKEMRDEVACKNEIRMMIKEIIREELGTFKQELEVKRKIQETTEIESSQRSYYEAVRDKKKESILIVKLKKKQKSETTKKLIKEKVDIQNLEVGITKLRKGSKRTVILRE